MVKIKNFILLPVLMIMFLGCGYSTRSLALKNYKKIHVEPFTNKINLTDEGSEYRKLVTYYPALEVNITQAVIDRFIFDGNLKVVQIKDADLILKGELIAYLREALRYRNDEDVEEYRIILIVNLSLWEKDKNEPLWQEMNFKGETTYFTSGSNAKTEERAIQDLMVDFSRRVIERIVEPW